MIYKDTRFFINSLDRTVESIKNNEKLEIDAEKNENEKYIEYKIKLKKEA